MPGLGLTLSLIRKSHRFSSHRATTRVGVPVATLDRDSLMDFLEDYFFPGQLPVGSLSGGSIKEMGHPNLAVNLSWSVIKGSANICAITLDGTSILPTGGNQSGTKNSAVVQDTDKTFILSIQDLAGKTASSQTVVGWKYPNFYGASSLDLNALLLLLEDNYPGGIPGFSKVLASNKGTNQNYDCTGGKYIYVLYPLIYANPAIVKNGSFDFTDYRVEDVVIKDVGGSPRNYKLFLPWDIANARQLQYFGSSVNINLQS